MSWWETLHLVTWWKRLGISAIKTGQDAPSWIWCTERLSFFWGGHIVLQRFVHVRCHFQPLPTKLVFAYFDRGSYIYIHYICNMYHVIVGREFLDLLWNVCSKLQSIQTNRLNKQINKILMFKDLTTSQLNKQCELSWKRTIKLINFPCSPGFTVVSHGVPTRKSRGPGCIIWPLDIENHLAGWWWWWWWW